ncbi:MAG: hypothetical protein MRZ25_02445 [Ruminococcus sp.]|nr:hypothetical protein [Ruminococcus sp.]MDY2855860.1 hypothetical protein [Oscillospiraceae bacterium]
MKDEINRRTALAFAVPVFFMVWFLIIGTAVFFNYENIIYGFPVYQSREPLVLTSGLIGGYVMCGLLCGTMFTTACLSQVGAGAKVALTVLFILPLFLAVTGVVYVIPYYIYNIGRIIYLKSKEKEAYAAAVQRQSQRNTIPPNRTEMPVYKRPENNYANYRAKPNINSANANANRNANNNAAPVGGFNNVPVGAVPCGAEHRNGTGTPNNGSTYQVPHYGSVPVGVNRTAGAVPNSTGRANTGNSNGQSAAGGSIPFVRNTANNTAVETPVANKTSAPKHYSNPYHDGFEMEG